MDIKWLKDFVSLANTCSFSAAAKERNVTQPTFSRRIRSLEEWVRTDLVDRSSHPVSLTKQGSSFLETAHRMIGLAYSTRAEFDINKKGRETPAIFSLTSDIPAHFFPAWLRQVESSTGQVDARITPSFYCPTSAIESLTQLKSDFLIDYDNSFNSLDLDSRDFEALTIFEDIVIPVCLKELQQHSKYSLPNSPEKSLPYISHQPNLLIGKTLKTLIAKNRENIHLETRYEPSSIEQIKNMVLQGFGVAWLNKLSVKHELEAGILSCIGDAQYHIPLSIKIYRNKHNTKKEVIRLWERLSDYYFPRYQMVAPPSPAARGRVTRPTEVL